MSRADDELMKTLRQMLNGRPDMVQAATETAPAAAAAVTAAAAGGGESKVQTRPKRCQQAECKKKIGLTDFACKCSMFFCSEHRYTEVHACSFDFKAAGKQQLEKQLIKTIGVKVDRI